MILNITDFQRKELEKALGGLFKDRYDSVRVIGSNVTLKILPSFWVLLLRIIFPMNIMFKYLTGVSPKSRMSLYDLLLFYVPAVLSKELNGCYEMKAKYFAEVVNFIYLNDIQGIIDYLNSYTKDITTANNKKRKNSGKSRKINLVSEDMNNLIPAEINEALLLQQMTRVSNDLHVVNNRSGTVIKGDIGEVVIG